MSSLHTGPSRTMANPNSPFRIVVLAGLIASLASAGNKRVMLVGHEPDMSELTAKLIAKGSPRPFEKAMVVGLQVGASGDHSRLRFVLDPKALGLDPDLRGSAA